MNAAYFADTIKEICKDYKDAVEVNDAENSGKDRKRILRLIDDMRSEAKEHFDSAFFSGELDNNAGEKEVQYPGAVEEYQKRKKKRKDSCSVKRFKERRQKRIDCASVKRFKDRRQKRLDDKDEGRWVTTENDHHIHINGEGVPDKGNPHVINAMVNGTKTREEIGRARVNKIRSRVSDLLKTYKDSDAKVKESAKAYHEKNQEFKHAEHHLDMVDKVYKKTLTENGYGEDDGERLKKEVEEIKRKLDADPNNRDLEGQYRNKHYLQLEWEDCYGEETKQMRKDYDRLKKENDDAKAEMQKHIDARRSSLEEARKVMGEKEAQGCKFYSSDERNQIKESVINSDGFKNLNDEEKEAISASIDSASDAQLAMLKKTMGNAKIMRYEDTAATTGCSHYDSGTGCMYLEEEDRKDPRVFWHEYGHYMDDFRRSGLEDNVVTFGEGSIYESSTHSFSDILEHDVGIRNADGAADLQDLFDSVVADKFEVHTNSDGTYIGIRDKKTGEYVDDNPNLSFDFQKAFDQKIKEYLHGGKDGGELNEYYRSIGYPLEDERPDRSQYFEQYVTPKRKLEREREKFKGAGEEYQNRLMEFYDKQGAVKKEHPEFYDKQHELYNRRKEREKHLPSVTDCLCGMMGGSVFSIYGCHSRDYYRRGTQVEKEWAANIHQLMFSQDKEALGLMEKLLPRTMKKVKKAYNEYLWRNMEI